METKKEIPVVYLPDTNDLPYVATWKMTDEERERCDSEYQKRTETSPDMRIKEIMEDFEEENEEIYRKNWQDIFYSGIVLDDDAVELFEAYDFREQIIKNIIFMHDAYDRNFNPKLFISPENDRGLMLSKDILEQLTKASSKIEFENVILANFEYFIKTEIISKNLPTSLPDVEYLNVSGCSELKYLKYLPKCKKLDAWGCSSLKQLPEILPECVDLDLTSCRKLLALPELPKCEVLKIGSCALLEQVPHVLPSIKKVDAFGCKNKNVFLEMWNIK